MRFTLTLVFVITFLLSASVLCKVTQVFFMHRHGARTPISNITNITEWGSMEQLTSVGMRQLYLLGDEFRRRYVGNDKLLSENYDPKTIYVKSTRVNRTLESASAFLAGLFPAGTGPKLEEKTPLDRTVPPLQLGINQTSLEKFALPKQSQVVPIHTVDKLKDFILRGYSSKDTCLNMKKFDAQAKNDSAYKMIMDKFNPIFDQVISALDIVVPKRDMHTMQNLADTIQMAYLDNRKLGGKDIDNNLFLQMEIFHNISALYLKYAYPIQSRVGSTSFFNEILKQMDAAVSGTSPLKFVEYSAHDDTVNCITTALNITSWQCLWENYLDGNYTQNNKSCPFTAQPGAYILFELLDEGDKKYVRFNYNDEYYPLVNGSDKLEYSEFKSFIKNITVDNYEEMCLGPKPEPKPEPHTDGSNSVMPWWQIVLLVLQAILIIALAAMLFNTFMKLRSQPGIRKNLLQEVA